MKPPILKNRMEDVKSVIGVDATDTSSATYEAAKYGNGLVRPAAITNCFKFVDVPFGNVNTITMAAWIKLNGWSVTNGAASAGLHIVMSGYSGANPMIQFYPYTDGCYYDINDGTHATFSEKFSGANFDITADVFTHWCFVISSSDVKFYKNGSNVDSSSIDLSTLAMPNCTLEIGSWGNGTNYEMDGTIDDFHVFNYCLTENEIKKIMNSERGYAHDD